MTAAPSGWRRCASLRTPRSEIYAAVQGGRIYVAGGIGFLRTLASCEVFDPAIGAWSPGPPLPRALHHVAMAADDRRVYAAGGFVSLLFRHDPAPKLWALAPGADAWSAIADLPEPVGEHVLVRVGAALYLIGGRTPAGDSDRVWAFDFVRGVFSARAAMPTPRQSMAAVVLNGEVWVLGGRSVALGDAIDRVEIYDPATDSWRPGPPMPQGCGGHAAAAREGRIHVFGGETFDPPRVLRRHDVFSLAEERWRAAEPPPLTRHGGAAAAVGHDFFIIGGGARPRKQTLLTVTGTTQRWRPSDADDGGAAGPL